MCTSNQVVADVSVAFSEQMFRSVPLRPLPVRALLARSIQNSALSGRCVRRSRRDRPERCHCSGCLGSVSNILNGVHLNSLLIVISEYHTHKTQQSIQLVTAANKFLDDIGAIFFHLGSGCLFFFRFLLGAFIGSAGLSAEKQTERRKRAMIIHLLALDAINCRIYDATASEMQLNCSLCSPRRNAARRPGSPSASRQQPTDEN